MVRLRPSLSSCSAIAGRRTEWWSGVNSNSRATSQTVNRRNFSTSEERRHDISWDAEVCRHKTGLSRLLNELVTISRMLGQRGLRSGSACFKAGASSFGKVRRLRAGLPGSACTDANVVNSRVEPRLCNLACAVRATAPGAWLKLREILVREYQVHPVLA
jgi:hypothetical protein